MSSKTTPPLGGTPPREGNQPALNSPPSEGWQAQPDGVVPKLRFPEFRDAGEWEIKQLKFICHMQAGKFVSASDISERDEKGLYPCYGGNGLRGYTKTYTHSGKYPLIGRQGALCGNVKFGVDRFYATEHAVVVTPKNNIDVNWLFYELNFLNLNRYATGQAQPGVSVEVLEKIPVVVPEIEKEQQKVADCLSSLDDRITAETQKLDTLKAHKKGLMQQLFPREGENQPRLRFPEFQNAGEWEKKPFSTLCEIKHGYAFDGEFFSDEGEYVLLTPGNFYEEGGYRDRGEKQKYYSGEIPRDYVLNYGDLLVAMTEQAAGLLGSPILVPESGKFLHNQRLGLVTKKPGVAWTNEFFFHVFNTQPVRKAVHASASGAKVRHTSPTKIGEVVFSFPPSLPEQQCIADCLATLEDLITAQTQKIDTLKTHKKGLMQQLFPALDEVKA